MKPEYRNKTLIAMVNILCYIFATRWTLFVTHNIHCVLCWSNTEFFWIQLKTGNKNTGDEKICLHFMALPKNAQCGN